MGGESKQTQTTQSQTQPWTEAQPLLKNILTQLQGGLNNTGVTSAENGALNTIVQNASNSATKYAPAVDNYATALLNGGNATAQSGNVNDAYQAYLRATQPLASNTNYDPMQTPGIGDQLTALKDNITQSVNGTFAGAGRDFSGYNQKALASGLAAGLAPVLTAQYNANVANQQGAAKDLYNASNTTAGIQTSLTQQDLANRGQGVTAAGQAVDTANAGANATLAAEAQRRGIPVQALGLLAQIGIPIAGLGSESNGTSTTTNQMSGVQQFMGITSGLANLFGGGGGSGGTTAGNIGNMIKFISDRNAKEDIEEVGRLHDGTPVYRYRYKGQPGFQIGLMAQDVEQYAPEAVGQIGQFKAVDYKLATDRSVRKVA
ncbi:tail fiber domain-containing protein [Bradyrhizobium yuanmingense]|uniref:tail fiber domain-containing protein n=1 Tax=Bradyrhizobium yuanmingense TaxID=108015 RepID=UPI000FE3EAF1|nr:tail fiber domain-containing protein [Bradyrhizobium yuanmingense]TGN75970.1 tail fiber domain-containing protein [Bradyrhizobium yuanmingense]